MVFIGLPRGGPEGEAKIRRLCWSPGRRGANGESGARPPFMPPPPALGLHSTHMETHMPGKALRRLAPAIALVFLSTLLAGFPSAGATVSGNSDLTAACGLEFALVIDRSGSVSGAGASATVRNAANAFLEALVDTGSKVSLTSFATTATVDTDISVNSGVVPLTTANLTAPDGLADIVNDLSFGNFTNWEDGLIKAQSTFGGFSDSKPDLVVMITDGNPNRYLNGSGTVTTGNTVTSTAEAKTRSDAIKLDGTHMFALGVTGDSGLNIPSLNAISGLDMWSPRSLPSAWPTGPRSPTSTGWRTHCSTSLLSSAVGR